MCQVLALQIPILQQVVCKTGEPHALFNQALKPISIFGR